MLVHRADDLVVSALCREQWGRVVGGNFIFSARLAARAATFG
jgi:hypothetical protein